MTLGSPATPAMAFTRFPGGPICRNASDRYRSGVSDCAAATVERMVAPRHSARQRTATLMLPVIRTLRRGNPTRESGARNRPQQRYKYTEEGRVTDSLMTAAGFRAGQLLPS